MKLLCLNIWGGQAYKPLLGFIREQSKDIDIFCFQEVLQSPVSKFSNGAKTDISSDLFKVLKDYNGFLATPFLSGYDLKDKVDFDLTIGQATFVRKGIKVLSEQTIFVYGKDGPVSMWNIKRLKKKYLDIPRNMHCITIKIGSKEILIGNLHGFWMPRAKTDTPQRVRQSGKVKEIFDPFVGPRILCGDFNLRPDTKSIRLLEENMKNLIIEFGITSTRSSLHKRKQKFADYIMISDEIKVNKFEAINENVSDHLPLLLDFSV